MKKHHFAAALILLAVSFLSYSAAISVSATDWQVKSLKGITSIKYGAPWDPSQKLSKAMGTALTGLGIPAKGIELKDGVPIPLSSTEALVTTSVDDDKEKGQRWVGVYVQQNSQLARTPAISYNAQTYRIGTVVPEAKTDEALKELLGQLVRDFKSQNK